MNRWKMRIVGGIAKGRRLVSPAIPGARPTSELIRGAIFNSLGPDIIQEATVVDLYAGVGSLGLESLSRGASFVEFVEKSDQQCQVIRRNLKAMGFEANANIHRVSVARALPALPKDCSVLLMDPPYRMTNLDDDLQTIADLNILRVDGMAVVGHSKRATLQPEYGALELLRTRRHGDSVVNFYRMRAAR